MPEWELGLAVGYATVPYYRGSASARDILLPLPLVFYRGKQTGIKKRQAKWPFYSRKIALEWSVGVSLPVPSGGEVSAREGMNGLDPTLQLGPKIDVRLWRHRRHRVSIVLPLRINTSLSFSKLAYQGILVSPFVAYQYKWHHVWEINVQTGPIYGSEKYHQYFYGVSRLAANVNRRFYQAKQGYSGSRLTIFLQKRFHRLWFSLFIRYDNLKAAAFEQSPLLEQKSTIMGGFALGWLIKKSPKYVRVGS